MASDAPTRTDADFRLPTNVKPTHYDLTLRTDLEAETFKGAVKIQIDILEPTSYITLNAAVELKLQLATLHLPSSTASPLSLSSSFDASTQRITYTLPSSLPADTHAELRIAFAGTLTDSMVGYYKSVAPGGIYALTQFEPIQARRALPCWDEPLLKATFALTMVYRAGTVALGNMNALDEDAKPEVFTERLFEGIGEKGGWRATRFATTPPMSTYLLAFANGHFEHLESSYTSPLSGKTRPLRVYATKDLVGQTQFVLDLTARAVPLYEQVFDVEYPLPKLDTLVAHDFDIGAMENWGLITGRTSGMLLDPAARDLGRELSIASMQTHEIAHMWFGNITTMRWWDNLYLKEGFATVMGESIILNRLFPSWRVNSQFINEHLNDALRLDAKPSSHPIEAPVPDPAHIAQIFDALSYAKAASVLRMLAAHVGEEHFLEGVGVYLKRHLYGSTVSRDLWEGIGKATGMDIPRIMDNWISKMGFPVLTVTETPTGITVRQDRFLESGPVPDSENATLWNVPLALRSVGTDGVVSVDNTLVLDAREAHFKLDTSRQWKLNADTTGVYRVLYAPARLATVATIAASPTSPFTLDDRLGLVHDALALSKAGHLRTSAALALFAALRVLPVSEALVWESVAENVGFLGEAWWENDRIVEGVDRFRRDLFKPLVTRLGYTYSASDSPATTQLRTLAITQVARARDAEVIAALRARFDAYVAGDNSVIAPDLLACTFETAVVHGGTEAWEAVYKIFEARNPTASVHIAAIRALGATQDPALIVRTCDASLSKARPQDVLSFFGGLARNHAARRALRDFFEANYDTVYDRFGETHTTKRLVSMVYDGFSTQADVEHVEKFFEGRDVSTYNMALAQALDSMRAKMRWIERSTDDVTEWLGQWEKSAEL